ncbi:MAG TPA: YceI family protein [Asticcacaulis sp.]|nr:YceI family protein [Asticcacaulis sp.]
MNAKSYNIGSIILHWLIAGLILFMVLLGWRLDPHGPHIVNLVFWHKSVGLSILLLSLLRIAIRVAYKVPPEPPMPAWQLWIAKALHFSFYLVMIGMPLSGWAMVSTSARDIPFFGLFHWPHFPGVPIEAGMEGPTHETFETIHKLIAKLLIYGMIPLHVLAALKHQFIDKDEVVEHMVPGLKPEPILNWRWLIPVGVVVLAVGTAEGIYRGGPVKAEPAESSSPTAASVEADMESVTTESVVLSKQAGVASSAESSASVAAVTSWTVDKAATKIAFTTSFEGEAINGGFSGYTAQISFDPEQLPKSHVEVTIDLASVNSGDNDRDTTLKSDSFFNIAVTPKAVFEAKSFTKKDATHFVAHGKLTLHGTTKPVELPFTLTIKDGTANMSGSTTLDRTAFGVGSGDYAATDNVPAAVKVDITLKAKADK